MLLFILNRKNNFNFIKMWKLLLKKKRVSFTKLECKGKIKNTNKLMANGASGNEYSWVKCQNK